MTVNDIADGKLRLIAQWADVYYVKYGVRLNIATLRKRRIVANIGFHVPPKAWFLSWEEFLEVTRTPLPLCKAVGTADPSMFKANDTSVDDAGFGMEEMNDGQAESEVR